MSEITRDELMKTIFDEINRKRYTMAKSCNVTKVTDEQKKILEEMGYKVEFIDNSNKPNTINFYKISWEYDF